MKNFQLLFTTLLCAAALTRYASALSCGCFAPGQGFSNTLYTKNAAVRVVVGNKIIKPTEPPVPFVDDDGEEFIAIAHMPESWLPSYYEAKIIEVYKQDENYKGPEMKRGDEIVVMGGSCSHTPKEDTEYVLLVDHGYKMDVSGYGGAYVLNMPGYCELPYKYNELGPERQKQLKTYAKRGLTPCFDGDCDHQFVAFPVPMPVECADGTVAKGSIVCEFNENAGQCQKDLKLAECKYDKKTRKFLRQKAREERREAQQLARDEKKAARQEKKEAKKAVRGT